MVQDNLGMAAARIVVIGIGGAGSNAVNRMIDEVGETAPVEFYVMNTDIQSLLGSKVIPSHQFVLGRELTNGLGAGGDPDIGRRSAEASAEEIRNIVRGANMVFLAAGMGGGTGTGATPVVAKICKEEKALTVAIVTRPFGFEGKQRIKKSIAGLNALKEAVDSIIIVSNDKLLMEKGNEVISNAFLESDRVLAQSVKTIVDLITVPGIINLDFADIRNTLQDSGVALIGYGMGEGPTKAIDAATAAINSPLLETPITGARRAICAVTCGANVSLYEAQECVNHIIEEAGNAVDVKLGVSINDQFSDQIIVSIIASDFPEEYDLTNKEEDEENEDNEVKLKPQEIKPISETKDEEEKEEDILPGFLKNKNIE
ncbi:MAG: cell division protein FtsZ [Bacilli bacterium]|nr:cell division protein FtsZ [Bacilli bacterium]